MLAAVVWIRRRAAWRRSLSATARATSSGSARLILDRFSRGGSSLARGNETFRAPCSASRYLDLFLRFFSPATRLQLDLGKVLEVRSASRAMEEESFEPGTGSCRVEDVMDLSIQLEKVLELFSSFILFSRLRIEAGLVTIKCDFELALRLRKKKVDGESKVKGCCVENEICIFNMQSGKRIMRIIVNRKW